MARNVAASYQKVQATTASPGQRVVLVYKAILKNIETAIAETEKVKDPTRFERINNSIIQAEQLIAELQLALDKERGGEIAENLDKLYSFWRRYLLKANMEKSKEKFEQIHGMVKDMTDAWVVAERNVRKDQDLKVT